MMQMQDNFGAFVDEDDDDDGELFDLPGMERERHVYQVGTLPMPDWFMAGVTSQKIIVQYGGCDVLVKSRYLHAPAGYYVTRFGNTFSIESPRQNQ